MNRFAGTTPEDRKSLVEAAIDAHRKRNGPFLTLEVDSAAERLSEPDDGPPPWIQYRDQDATLNLDCTDTEREAIRAVIADIGGVRITEQESIEDGGTNLRVSVPGDDERVAHVIERLLVEGFGLPEDVRLWAAHV